jgi:hypothetical protein
MGIDSNWRAGLGAFSVLAAMVAGEYVSAGNPGQTYGRERTTLERMAPERLEAAHADVQRIQAGRQEVSRDLGLRDRRAIFHAHAQDAAHTGGTLPEMLEDAKRAGVSIVFLSNHYRPPFDFVDDNWRGDHDGVLFIPGSETHGLLIQPMTSVMDVMDSPKEEIIKAVTAGQGMAFLSHVEERVDHPMDGLTGMEIYNRHADAKDDMNIFMPIIAALTDPELYANFKARVDTYPDEMLAIQLDYPELYLQKWDDEAQKQRVVGVAANDCHHNQVFISKMVDANTVLVGTIVDSDEDMRPFTSKQFPGIAKLTEGHEPGEILARLDFDPYYRSMRNVSTHILVDDLNEEAVRTAVLAGHAYVSHDWMCDPTGFYFAARNVDDAVGAAPRAVMGDEVALSAGLRLTAEVPAEAHLRLVHNGEVIEEADGRELEITPDEAGVYRLEAFLNVDGELRAWIYSNPIYVRQ